MFSEPPEGVTLCGNRDRDPLTRIGNDIVLFFHSFFPSSCLLPLLFSSILFSFFIPELCSFSISILASAISIHLVHLDFVNFTLFPCLSMSIDASDGTSPSEDRDDLTSHLTKKISFQHD